jgi:hypothetical protein
MNEIKVTTELCAEDRARLDKLTAALEQLAPITMQIDETVMGNVTDSAVICPDNLAGTKDHEDFVEIIPEGTDLNDLTGAGTYEKETGPEEPAAPQHTKAELQPKVVSLVSAGKKEEVKEIIKQYAAKVSDIPEEKVDEVWAKLEQLEG